MIFGDGAIATVVNGNMMALADATIALLSGRVGFRDHVATGRPAAMRVACFEYPCYRCNAISMIWDVERETIQGPCGTTADVHRGSNWATDRAEAGAEVRRRVTADANRLRVPIASLGRGYSATAAGSYTAFGCPWCNALFGDWFLRSYMLEARTEDAYLVIEMPGSLDRIPSPHWCLDSGSGLCVDRSD